MNEKIRPLDPREIDSASGPRPIGEPQDPGQPGVSKERPRIRADDVFVYALMTVMAALAAVSSLQKRDTSPIEQAPVGGSTRITAEPLSAEQMAAFKKAQNDIVQYRGTFASGDARRLIAMLDPNKPISQVCRFTSDWMLKEDKNLEILLQYLKKTRSEWPAEIESALTEARKMGGILAPSTNDALVSMIEVRLARKQPLNCGFGLLFIGKKTQQDAQVIGSQFISEVLSHISKESRTTDPQKLAELAPVLEAAVAVIGAAMNNQQ